MSEPNQEDLSVEDILSSIKNILVDDSGAPITADATPAPQAPKPVAAQPAQPAPKADDDVFDLDASMIVDDNANATEINRLLATPVQAPAPQTAPTPQTAPVAPAPVQPAAQTQAPATAPTQNLVDSIDINKTLDLANNLDISGIPALDDFLKEEPAPKPQPAPAAEVKEDTIDASANIINNFAKLFAEKQQEQQSQNSAIAAQVSGEIESHNLPDMVKNAIINQVKISLDANFDKLAAGIIAEQTRIWLDKNLAAVVEKTVAKEIERVIAKVGS